MPSLELKQDGLKFTAKVYPQGFSELRIVRFEFNGYGCDARPSSDRKDTDGNSYVESVTEISNVKEGASVGVKAYYYNEEGHGVGSGSKSIKVET